MDENYKVKIGQRIKQLREFRGYSQETLGSLIDMEPPSISKIENGKYSPSLHTLMKIIKALNIAPNDFFEYEHIMSDEELEKEITARVSRLASGDKQFVFRLLKYLQER